MEGRRKEDLQLYERVAVLEASGERVETKVDNQGRDIKELLALANKSKGALFVLMSVSTMIGGLVAWFASTFFGGRP